MQIFLDTANLSEIEKYASSPLISGITTNPTFLKKEGVTDFEIIEAAEKVIKRARSSFLYFVEIVDSQPYKLVKKWPAFLDDIIDKMHKRIIFKVPFGSEELTAINLSRAEGISYKFNLHLVYSINQALMAAKLGVEYICILMGRCEDENSDAVQLLRDIKQVYNNYNFNTKIMAASIRNTRHVKMAALVGVDAITVSPRILDKMGEHILTTKGRDTFLRDAQC